MCKSVMLFGLDVLGAVLRAVVRATETGRKKLLFILLPSSSTKIVEVSPRLLSHRHLSLTGVQNVYTALTVDAT